MRVVGGGNIINIGGVVVGVAEVGLVVGCVAAVGVAVVAMDATTRGGGWVAFVSMVTARVVVGIYDTTAVVIRG